MYTYEEQCVINLADSYTLLHSFIVRALLDECGVEGEQAAREGVRRFGRDRAMNTRSKHLQMGAKINMKSLFSLGRDLPTDPRFRRELQELNPQERVSHTLICPMADVWKAYGEREIGRLYCEEFHFACYNTYAYGYTQVNLAKTLTQEMDDYCAFNVILRPENLPEELRPVCFAEYDPGYVEPEFQRSGAKGKAGFSLLSIKLYYYLLEAAEERLGEKGTKAVEKSLQAMAKDAAFRLKKTAADYGKEINTEFVDQNYTFSMDPDDDPAWDNYSKHDSVTRIKRYLIPLFTAELGK